MEHGQVKGSHMAFDTQYEINLIYTKGNHVVWEGNIGLGPGKLRTCHPISHIEPIPHVKLKSCGQFSTWHLRHVMTAQVMWLNIQCQCQSNLKLSKTNVQYENVLFYFNLRGVYVGWKDNLGLSPG